MVDSINIDQEGDEMGLALVLSISQLILKHGVPVALQLVKDWDVKEPTLEDILKLKDRVPRPETYFEKDDSEYSDS